VRFDIPAEGEIVLSGARLLDRNGTAIQYPITTSARVDPDGQRWLSADLTLAPLAGGDYLVELAAGEQKVVAAIRVAR